MIGFKVSYDSYVDLFIATESITVGGVHFLNKLKSISSLQIKGSSILGGLVKPQFGDITFLNDGKIENYLDLTVTAYIINVNLDTVSEIGPQKITQSKRTLDTVTFTVWEEDNDVLTPDDKLFGSQMDTGLDTSAFYYVRSLLGITSITTVEDNSVACPSYSGFKESITDLFLPKGSSAVHIVDELLKARCCLGIRSGNSIEVINLFTGYKAVHHLKRSMYPLSISRNKYKKLTISSNYACFSDVDYSDKDYRTDTEHILNPYGNDIKINAYLYYTATRTHAVNAYTVFLSFPQVVIDNLTVDKMYSIGDLVVVDDMPYGANIAGPTPFTFLVTGMEYSSSLDSYKIFGVGTEFEEFDDGSGGTYWTTNNCPLWDQSGTTPTSTLRTPADGQTFDNINRVTITWDHVDAIIQSIYVEIQQTAPITGAPHYINICSKNVKSDGTTMSCIVPLDLVPGTYTFTINIPNIGIWFKDANQTPPRSFTIT